MKIELGSSDKCQIHQAKGFHESHTYLFLQDLHDNLSDDWLINGGWQVQLMGQFYKIYFSAFMHDLWVVVLAKYWSCRRHVPT